jgi:hypothetical protein
MEKLDLYSEPESPPAAAAATVEPIIFKTRVARLPRLLRAADLVAEEQDEGATTTILKRGMPRLVVTAVDTPRKYFKSRGGSSTTAAAAADVANAAASTGTASSTPGPRSLRKAAAAGSGNISSRAVTTAASAAEEAAISIYTDENSAAVGDAVMTPQADRSSGRARGTGTAARSSRSTRKKNPEAATNAGTRIFLIFRLL